MTEVNSIKAELKLTLRSCCCMEILANIAKLPVGM